MTMSLRAHMRMGWPWHWPVASMRGRDSMTKSLRQSFSKPAARSLEETAVRKPRRPILMPRMGVPEPLVSRTTRSIVPSPPKTRSRSAMAGQGGRVGKGLALQTSHARGLNFRRDGASGAGDAGAASRTTARLEGFSKLASKPMRRSFSGFFSSSTRNSLLPAGPSRGEGSRPPAQAGGVRGECFQFVQNAA
jgi:hypothetical protein